MFDLQFTMEGKAMRHEVKFDVLLDAAEEHLPDAHGYINHLKEEIDASYLDYTELVDALEAEGFDFELLVRNYLDHMPADRFYQVDAPPPELMEAAQKLGEELRGMDFDKLRESMNTLQKANEMIMLDKCLLKASKKLLNQSFMKLMEFDKKKRQDFYDLINHYTWLIATKIIGLRWMGMDSDEEYEKWETCLDCMTAEGMTARIKEGWSRRQESYPHPFTLELVGTESWWDVVGENEVILYAHVVTEEGDAYLNLHFKDIKDEAFLHDPALYERILELEGSIEAVTPKETEVVKALMEEKRDLTPLLYSYCKEHGNIKTHLLCQMCYVNDGRPRECEYFEFLNGREDKTYPNVVPWKQKCAIVQDKLVKLLLGILQKDFPEVMEHEDDYRVTAWAHQELKTLCSNLLYDIVQEYSELHEGGVVWPDEPEKATA